MPFTLKQAILLVTIAVWSLCACSNSRHLAKGESLYVGSRVHVAGDSISRKERKILKSDLEGLVRPRPNTTFLGIRLKLSLYHAAGNTKRKKGLKQWIRNKVGEPPVLSGAVQVQANKVLMTNFLENRGYFYAHVSGDMKVNKKKKATAVFEVVAGSQYTINKVFFTKDSSRISIDIDSDFRQTLLTPGAPYNLELIKAERTRIERTLKEKGYYYFKADYLLVVVDSSIGTNKVNMYVKLKKKEIPDEAYVRYTINDIFIYADFRLQGKKQDTSKADKVLVDSYYIIDSKKSFKPSVFADAMVFEKGDQYSLDDQNASLSRLVNMGTFKFVKNRFAPLSDTLLDVYYYLTPFARKAIRFEIGALTQNDNRAGTEGSISWRNRNAFRGAEQLLFKINGGIEAQYSGLQKQPNIYNFGAEADLTFPRFVVPFVNIQTTSRYLPKTVVKLKYNYESESDLLRINSYTASYGYDWKEGPHKQHQFYPFNFTYVKTDTLATDRNRLNALLYSNLVFEGIIVGPTYEFTYTSAGAAVKRNSFYFDGLIDLSGNILGLAEKADYNTNPRILFGSHYAQYLKFQPDFRYYLRFSKYTAIASRVMLGLGLPYGNSSSLPNIKQFWAGGNSDLRGFPSRLLGPGTFNDSVGKNPKYIETLGDIKLEGNIEVRQNLYKFINGAIFVDAGNIWLYRDNPDFQGGTFSSGFYKELAVDAGFGLRFDFSILVLRLDLGIPMRKPWLPENNRWVFDQISFGESSWRRQNMIFNIGIGYPF